MGRVSQVGKGRQPEGEGLAARGGLYLLLGLFRVPSVSPKAPAIAQTGLESLRDTSLTLVKFQTIPPI